MLNDTKLTCWVTCTTKAGYTRVPEQEKEQRHEHLSHAVVAITLECQVVIQATYRTYLASDYITHQIKCQMYSWFKKKHKYNKETGFC